ncbi:hypothetical protein IWX90DRAFT_129057 [Phyllosticta citrichinensis]|uniref:Plus3 domain-containing protein n=1 Tax=Phyllosticta citrichinensis TaxID=1130410 RepID=A0ABR1Y4N1_9PEZI
MSDDGLDLDAELLALAGDAAGDDEQDDGLQSRQSRSPSPRSSPQPSGRHTSPEQSPPRRKTKSRKTGGRRRKDDSEEEGEASDGASSQDSLGSGAMDESDSDAGADSGPDDSNPYPIEGKFTSYEDKARIMGLPELERESILAERSAEMERRTQDLNMMRLMAGRQAKEDKKRKAGTVDLDEDQRKSSRQRIRGVGDEKLAAYKKQREQTFEQRNRRNRTRRSPSVASERRQSDLDAEGDSDVEWDERRKSPARDEPPAELRDFERVRVGRSNFSKVCFYPGFGEHLIGCYCRVSIGQDKSTGQGIYRMCQIKDFTEGNPYTMQGSTGKPVKTDQYVLVTFGKAEKEWPFIMCSDSRFTEAEFEKYKRTCETDGVKIPTRSKLNKYLNGIHSLLERRWTDEEIAEKLRRQNKYAYEMAAVTRNTPVIPTRELKLQALNKSIRKANREEVRNALTAKAVEKAAAAEKARLAKLEEEQARKVTGDPLFDGSDISRTGTPSQPKEKKERKGIPTFTKKTMDDEMIGSMDLGIDVEI